MCMLLYGGSQHELPLTDPSEWEGVDVLSEGWLALAPRVTVTHLSPDVEVIRQHITEKCVVEIGAYGGCACGLNRLAHKGEAETSTSDELAEDNAARESRSAITEYIRKNSVSSLYYCWQGDEQLPSEGNVEISLSQLTDPTFALPERVILRIRV